MKAKASQAGALELRQPATQTKENDQKGMPLHIHINTTPSK